MRVRVWVLFAVLFVTLLSVAQVNLGVITGTVRGKAGAVVAGATVTAKNVDTSFERTVQTNSLGSYIMPAMPLGTYEVTITSQACSTYNCGAISRAANRDPGQARWTGSSRQQWQS